MSNEPELRVEALFELGEGGILKDKLTGARVFVISRQGWRAFNDELESNFLDAAHTVMERMGYSYGRLMGRAAKKMSLSPTDTFQALFELATAAGWGGLSLSAGDLSNATGVLKIEHCVFCESLLPRVASTCYFLPGVVNGVADEVVGGSNVVQEIRCVCSGAPNCEISVNVV
jgi:predicted hydrocarbon binding protein